jgi:hypothetical protein
MSCCGKVIHGAVGLTKAALNIDNVHDEVKESRRNECRACEFSEKKDFGGTVKVRLCSKCGCYIAAKTKLKDEKCPIGKW